MSDNTSQNGLRLLVHEVNEVGFGEVTSLDAGCLSVSSEEISHLLESPALASTRLTWVSPGQSARIVKLLDAVQPRTKGPRGGGIFPGFLGPAHPQGRGETHLLRNVAVVTAGRLPRAQEAVVQMSGKAADLSFLASTHNLVIEFEPAEGASWEDVERALRSGILRVAESLAEAALPSEPDEVHDLPGFTGGRRTELPRIGTITNLQTQGSFKDVFVYGRSMSGSLPTAIDANDLDDGAVVGGQYGHPGLKNCTYLYQNHPVVRELRSRDGADLEFAGVMLSPEPVEQSAKELASAHAARLCAALDMDAVVITKEGGGNADSDNSLKMDACEAMGITAVGIFAEMSGAEGLGPPLVSPPTNASAMVSTGNYDEVITLEAVDLAVGGEVFDLTGQPATEEMAVATAAIYGSLNPLGIGRLTCAQGVGS